ncbi:hypothetical protein HX021_09995 [Sphingobacterium sp. N143]|uniref:DUF6266 family protein n=1 Tax=Sphingobacterium sp. N143 TaxID=2746727 RepID=UPI002575A3CD|nr:DUF6266 family protein [Sphingobacterium sp. N143]MDM1294621.1 hypothetical protein [Sphingobacterium sp. N143]
MAQVKNGVNGAPSGKVGAVVFCSWKGINYVRSLPTVNKRREITEKEVKNRGKFGFTQTFLAPYKKMLRLGFDQYDPKMTAFNAAMSYHLGQAVIQDDKSVRIDYEKFSISRGLEEVITAATAEMVDGKILIKWKLKNQAELYDRELGDFRTLFLLLPENTMDISQAIFLGNYIDDMNDSIALPQVNKTTAYHLYLGFAAVDGSNRSMNSSYLGRVVLEKNN